MANAKAKALKNKIKGIKNAVIDKTSDVLSFPQRAYYGMKIRKANKEYEILRTARNYDNAPDFDEHGNPTEAFKVRSLAKDIKERYNRQ